MPETKPNIVYQFLDVADDVLYVGRTNRAERRLRQEHFTSRGHLPQECYWQAHMILYVICESEDDAKIKERFLINKLAPRFNTQMNNNSKFDFTIEFDWKYMPVDKSQLDSSLRTTHKHQVPRVAKPLHNVNFPTFVELRDSLGSELTADFSAARTEGPDPIPTWLDGRRLDRIIKDAWAELPRPGEIGPTFVLEIAFNALVAQDWSGYTIFTPDSANGLGDIITRRASGNHNNRISWLTSSSSQVLQQLHEYMLPWHQAHSQTEILCTLAANLHVTQRLYTDREDYLLRLAYLRDLLLACPTVESQFLVAPCNIYFRFLPDWFFHQSIYDGYFPSLREQRVEPMQNTPGLTAGKSPEAEAERQWQRAAYKVGKPLADQWGREVWVFNLDEAKQLEYLVERELKRLLDGATGVFYHNEFKEFDNKYDLSRIARSSLPVGFEFER